MHLWVGETKVYKLLDMIESVCLLAITYEINISLSNSNVSQELQLLHSAVV